MIDERLWGWKIKTNHLYLFYHTIKREKAYLTFSHTKLRFIYISSYQSCSSKRRKSVQENGCWRLVESVCVCVWHSPCTGTVRGHRTGCRGQQSAERGWPTRHCSFWWPRAWSCTGQTCRHWSRYTATLVKDIHTHPHRRHTYAHTQWVTELQGQTGPN